MKEINLGPTGLVVLSTRGKVMLVEVEIDCISPEAAIIEFKRLEKELDNSPKKLELIITKPDGNAFEEVDLSARRFR